jgi:hypothetical protein
MFKVSPDPTKKIKTNFSVKIPIDDYTPVLKQQINGNFLSFIHLSFPKARTYHTLPLLPNH